MKSFISSSLLVLAFVLSLTSCASSRLAEVHGKGIPVSSKKFADLGIVPKGVQSNGDGYTINIATLLEEETEGKLSDDEVDFEDGATTSIADLLEELGIHEETTEVKPAKEKTQDTKIACDNVWIMQLKEWADTWLGVPYLFGGTTRAGIDCSAFTGTLYKNVFEVVLQRNSRAQYSQDCYMTVKQPELVLGDLVFFITNGKPAKSTNISHVGVYVGDNIFVHSSSSKGVVYSRLTDKYWTKAFLIGGRVLQWN